MALISRVVHIWRHSIRSKGKGFDNIKQALALNVSHERPRLNDRLQCVTSYIVGPLIVVVVVPLVSDFRVDGRFHPTDGRLCTRGWRRPDFVALSLFHLPLLHHKRKNYLRWHHRAPSGLYVTKHVMMATVPKS